MLAATVCSLILTSSPGAPPDLGHIRPLTVPPGFEVVKVAGPPLVDRPVVCCFDDKGRLYVADSSGSNEKPDIQLQKKPHRIVRLEDTDGDGIFDKSIVFADQMMFLQGVMWKDGSLFVGAPPHIWKLTDTDNDGKADKREIWFDGKTLTGCANDLHGPYAGPDGYIYWTKGAFAKQEYTLPNGKKWASRCATILRAKPDGSNLEPVMTGGMDNPVDVVFLPNGERIFSTTFFQHPANGRRDGLVHAVYGAMYGKDHDPVYELPWTGPTLMPPMTHLGPAAPAGLHRYESRQFGDDFHGNLFCAQFNMRTVSRHILQPLGSTYSTIDSPFVTSEDVDFHPTDVIEDADGSLLVVDTGGWYKLCCPSSQLVKPDVLGGIYRVRKIGSHKTREKPAAVSLSRHYLTALNRDPAGFDAALRDLNHPILHIRRQAAEALGRISGKRAVPELLRSLADPDHDRVLQHTLTYALIEIGDVDGTRAGLSSTNPRVKCAVLAALHAMPNGIRSGDVIPLVSETRKTDLRLRETAWWILIRHPEWAPELTGFIPNRLAEQFDDDGTTIRNLGTLTQHPAVQSIVADILQNPKSSMTAIQNAARVMDASPLKQTPESWFAAMTAALKRMPQSGEIHTQLLRVCSRLKPGSKQYPQPFVDALLAFGGDEQLSVSTRLSGLAALPANQISINSSTLSLVLTTIEHKDNAHVGLAWEALQRIRIEDNQWPQVVRLAASLSAVEMPRFVNLFDRTRSETTGLMLLKLLNSPEILSKLRVDFLKPVLDKYPESVRKNAASLYAVLDRARAGDVQKFESLLKELPPGDIRRGQVVFHSQKANCKACHTIGYVGGKIGPDLTRIGSIRTERDLLESIVFPSASFVRSYEPVKVETTDGRTLNGNVKSDQADELVLTIAADQEVRIARKDIESVQPGTISVMPSGLDQQMSKQELADLVAFLKANK